MDDLTTVFIFTDNTSYVLAEGQTYLVKVGIGVAVVISLVLITRKRTKKLFSESNLRQLFFISVCGGIFLFHALMQWSNQSTYQGYLDLYTSGQCQVAQGIVHVERISQGAGCHEKGDIVEIEGVEFEVSACRDNFGYDTTIVQGGILAEGTYARVYYYDEPNFNYPVILRVDVKSTDG